jgi:site-specific DNA-methyltransferase (adenine-specific)
MRAVTQIKYNPRMMPADDLVISKYNTRYNRTDAGLVEALKKSIAERGYDENFPLLVAYIGDSEQAEVIGGAHRLTACREVGIKDIPANVYEGITADEAVAISFSNNQNQQTFKPETFLDMAHQIHRIHKEEGKSLEVIGGMFGISRQYAGFYDAIVSELHGDVLEIVEESNATKNLSFVADSEVAPVAKNATNVALVDWQFSWFRHITPRSPKYQRLIVQKILDNKNRTGKQIEEWSGLFKGRQYLEAYFTEHVPEEFLESYLKNLDDSTYDSRVTYDKKAKEFTISESLLKTIEELKEQSKSRFENTDCLTFIPTLPDKSIDVLMTDPPYGVEYVSNRRKDVTNDLHKPIANDTEVDAMELLTNCLAKVDSKMKDDSHCYIFCDWEMYPQVKEIVDDYFAIKNLLIWQKNNHGAGDLKGSYAPIYECIIYGVKGKKDLRGGRIPDVIPADKVASAKMEHPTEKPVELLELLLSKSSDKGEVVFDPFAGVGTTLLAARKLGIGYIGTEIQSKFHETGQLKLKEVETK